MLTHTKQENMAPGIKEVKLSPQILENPDVLPHLLTDLEYKIFEIVKEGKPATVKEIRDGYIKSRVPWMVGDEKIDSQFSTFYKELLEKRRQRKITSTKFISFLEDGLKRIRGFEIPSFQRIDRILESLEDLGLVTKRYDPLKKGKYLWIVNPAYLIAIKKRK